MTIDLDMLYRLEPRDSPVLGNGLSIAKRTVHRFSGYNEEVCEFLMNITRRRPKEVFEWVRDRAST